MSRDRAWEGHGQGGDGEGKPELEGAKDVIEVGDKNGAGAGIRDGIRMEVGSEDVVWAGAGFGVGTGIGERIQMGIGVEAKEGHGMGLELRTGLEPGLRLEMGFWMMGMSREWG